MDLGRIYEIKEALETEQEDLIDIAEVNEAFEALVGAGVALRDEPGNATASDMLEELEEHATKVERVIYEWVKKTYGEQEANNPSWSTSDLARELNEMQVISGAEDGRLGFLLGE